MYALNSPKVRPSLPESKILTVTSATNPPPDICGCGDLIDAQLNRILHCPGIIFGLVELSA